MATYKTKIIDKISRFHQQQLNSEDTNEFSKVVGV